MVSTEETNLTDRQVEVLQQREAGRTQREVADDLGTTTSNISAIERAAEKNVRKAQRTLELVRTIRAPVRFTVSAGTYFDDLVDLVYERGDEAGINVAYCRPELFAHLYRKLEEYTAENKLETVVGLGITEQGEVEIFTNNTKQLNA